MKGIRRIAAILTVVCVALVAAPAATGAPRGCESPDQPGCKSETETTKEAGNSGGFNETTTQQGRVGAPGTLETQVTECTGPSGKVLRPDHPQCD